MEWTSSLPGGHGEVWTCHAELVGSSQSTPTGTETAKAAPRSRWRHDGHGQEDRAGTATATGAGAKTAAKTAAKTGAGASAKTAAGKTAAGTRAKTASRSPEPRRADAHDLIRVHGARVNNLKDVSVEIPKRRLTVFTGVSGSGKSSLVFGTIAAESQRLINETYSAFVQGFMPTAFGAARGRRARRSDHRDRRRPAAHGRRHSLHGRHRRYPTPTRCCASCSAGSGSRTSARPARTPSTSPRSGRAVR